MNEQGKCLPLRKGTKNKDPAVRHFPLPKGHKCYGCVWYPRDVDILYCPFQSCVRYQKGFVSRKKPDE